jgi:hypothetical protein
MKARVALLILISQVLFVACHSHQFTTRRYTKGNYYERTVKKNKTPPAEVKKENIQENSLCITKKESEKIEVNPVSAQNYNTELFVSNKKSHL